MKFNLSVPFSRAMRGAGIAGILLLQTWISAPLSIASAKEARELNPAPIIEAALAAKAGQAVPVCPNSDTGSRAGLSIRDGRVMEADLIGEIGGYAGAAGTTGGLGGRLLVVTTNADYDSARERPIPGSLRDHVDSAKRNHEGVWIVFDLALGPNTRIELKATLRPPSNVTIDGSCAGVTLEAPHESPIMLDLHRKTDPMAGRYFEQGQPSPRAFHLLRESEGIPDLGGM